MGVQPVTLPIRPFALMIGGALLAAAVLGWLAVAVSGTPALAAALAMAAACPVLLLGWLMARHSADRTRMAADLRDKTAALIEESNKRRAIELALDRYVQRERLFSAAVESAGHPVISKTLDGTITAWNPAAERLFGFTAAEAIGNNVDIIIPPDFRDEHAAMVAQSLADRPVEMSRPFAPPRAGEGSTLRSASGRSNRRPA